MMNTKFTVIIHQHHSEIQCTRIVFRRNSVEFQLKGNREFSSPKAYQILAFKESENSSLCVE